jgi:hypothetical protein
MGHSDVAVPKALPQMNVSWTLSKASKVAMDNTDMAAAHILVKMNSPDTPSGVAGDRQEYMKVMTDKLVEARTSLVVVAWQVAVSRQHVENTSQSVSMR